MALSESRGRVEELEKTIADMVKEVKIAKTGSHEELEKQLTEARAEEKKTQEQLSWVVKKYRKMIRKKWKKQS